MTSIRRGGVALSPTRRCTVRWQRHRRKGSVRQRQGHLRLLVELFLELRDEEVIIDVLFALLIDVNGGRERRLRLNVLSQMKRKRAR